MFKVNRVISASHLSNEQLFDLISNKVNELTELWSLEDPKCEKVKDSLRINLTSKHFEGYFEVLNRELQIFANFKSLLKFNKNKVEKELDFWIQDVFSTRYDQ